MRKILTVGLAFVLAMSLAGTALADLPPGGTFTDDDGNTHEADIEAIAAEGVTKGCNPPDNTWYCPDRLLSRAEMSSFLARALRDLIPS